MKLIILLSILSIVSGAKIKFTKTESADDAHADADADADAHADADVTDDYSAESYTFADESADASADATEDESVLPAIFSRRRGGGGEWGSARERRERRRRRRRRNAADELQLVGALLTCTTGFANETLPNGTVACVDINECTTLKHNCSDGNPCVNSAGSFWCNCTGGFNRGFAASKPWCENADECKNGMHDCKKNEKFGQGCKDTRGSFECVCNVGYQPDGTTSGANLNCTDVHECNLGRANCHAKAQCTNTAGSFKCTCNDGYMGDGITCGDYDQCVFKKDSCHKDANCEDTVGSFRCTCKTGFYGNGTVCSNIDECQNQTGQPINQTGVNSCQKNLSTCVDTEGSYECECKLGYTGSGSECEDVDECVTGLHNCPELSNCTNTPGSFSCSCSTGYKMNSKWQCQDIDECMDNLKARNTTATTTLSPLTNQSVPIPAYICHANASCHNVNGSYQCNCNAGWMGQGTTCVNMDECKSSRHDCALHAQCIDTLGSFTCKCLPGYNGTGTKYLGEWPPVSGCWDIDECQNETQFWLHNVTNKTACVSGAKCTNTDGSFICKCESGYYGDGLNCTNIDECKVLRDNCDSNANCTDTVGSFTCKCNMGYVSSDLHGLPTPPGTWCKSEKTLEVRALRARSVLWSTVRFTSEFKVPPVVVVNIQLQSLRQLTARVTNVTTTSFRMAIAYPNTTDKADNDRFAEWLTQNLPFLTYIAAAPGARNLSNGTLVQAGFVPVRGSMMKSTACAGGDGPKSWSKVNFKNYSSRPVILAQLTGIDDKNYTGGAQVDDFCSAGLRFNTSGANATNDTNNSAWFSRICPKVSTNKTTEQLGWIAIGGNWTSFAYNGKNVRYANVVYYKNLTGSGVLEGTGYGHNFTKVPLVISDMVTTTEHVVGYWQFVGDTATQANFKVTENTNCPSKKERAEYANFFAVESSFSI